MVLSELILSCSGCLQLQEYLDKFIEAMQELFDKHKTTAGYADYKLYIV
jgi:hypothetical protein